MTPQEWANKLRSEVEGRVADCCLEDMTPEEQRDSVHDMILDFCSDHQVPLVNQGLSFVSPERYLRLEARRPYRGQANV